MDRSDLSSFGTMLKAFRTRRGLTQQQLAEQLGVRRNTIGTWERGDVLPGSKGIVLELAKHLHLDDQEIRHLLEASLTALSPSFLVPFLRNPFFTGREEILEALQTHLGTDHVVALTQSYALHGLGGIGKTQIALEYAYRHALEYSAVFWIEAETGETVVSSLLRIAESLEVPERREADQPRIITAVQRWLSSHSGWLLIWDNVEDLSLLDRFLPSARSGAILITTRCQTLGTLARGLDLLPMEHEEGILFLLRRAKVLEPDATREQVRQLALQMHSLYAAASELVMAMGGLPLALDQAGAYLEETHCGLPAYLNLFRVRRAALLQQRGEGSRDHPASVSTTFALAIAATTQRHQTVWALLRVCALLQPDAIPEELFRQGGEHLGGTLEAACRDALEWDRVIAIACGYSLLSRQPEAQTLSIHRLVQAVLLDAMTEVEQEQWTQRAIAALDAVFPEVLPGKPYLTWKQAERLVPHALLCLQRVGAAKASLVLASLAYKVAQYLFVRGRYREAEPLYLSALRIRELVMGPDHPDLASPLNSLAALYTDQGKYAEAEALFQRAWHIWEQTLGPDHPDIARPLNNLAILSYKQGKHAQAEAFFQRALEIREQALGADHLKVASSLNNLAEVYWQQGKHTEAKRLYQRALCILEQQLGPDHPDVAHPLNGLANLLRDQNHWAAAGPLYQRARAIRERYLDQQHPETAQTLSDLAVFYQKQDKLNEALSLADRALSIRSHSLGEAHPKTVATRTFCAQLRHEQRMTEEGTSPDQPAEEGVGRFSKEPVLEGAPIIPQETAHTPLSENHSFQEFLDACCELHSRAWSRASDLWHAYEHWAADHQERFPLSRRDFAAQLKAHGCRADRTNTARIWRGIALANPNRDTMPNCV